MTALSDGFGPFDGVFLNSAGDGPLPRSAVAAGHAALAWKISPNRLTEECYDVVVGRLKRALAKLINAAADDIILGNSASYGMHLFANGLPLESGDDVLLVDGDFPTTIYAWLPLARRGVEPRLIKPAGAVVTAEEIADHMTPRTRIFCTNWVNSFTGCAADIDAIGALCRDRGVTFILNISQAIGARPLDLATAMVDAVTTCGNKWLCGPYATGFCWLRPALRESLVYDQAYWVANLGKDRLANLRTYVLRDDLGAAKYDVFGTANLNNFMPWTESVETLLDAGMAAIAAHDQALVSRLIDGLDDAGYRLLSPRDGAMRSTLVMVSHRRAERNPAIHQALAAESVFVALREGNLRFSPHLYNSNADIDRALEALNAA